MFSTTDILLRNMAVKHQAVTNFKRKLYGFY